MTFHQLVSTILLLAYAVPAAIGPGWHLHHHATPLQVLDASPESTTLEPSIHGGDEKCEHCDHTEANSDDSDPTGLRVRYVHSSHVHDGCMAHCIVCAFYAQSVLATQRWNLFEPVVRVDRQEGYDARFIFRLAQPFQARGPPR